MTRESAPGRGALSTRHSQGTAGANAARDADLGDTEPGNDCVDCVDEVTAAEETRWTRETDELDAVRVDAPEPNGDRALIDDIVAGRYAGQPADIQDALRSLANDRTLDEQERRRRADGILVNGVRCIECGADVLKRDHDRDCPNRVHERLDNRLTDHAYVSSQVCKLPPLEPLVDGLLFLPGESVLYSPPKLAKTFWAIDLALSVASGQMFMGRRVRQGPVVFVVAEGVGGLGARVTAWHDSHGRGDNYVDDVTFVTTTVNLLDAEAVTNLCAFLKSLGAVLTIIDTLHRCTPGAEENSARDMGQVVESLDQLRNATGGHVLVVHHAGKDVSRGMRGSSALLGAVDTVIEMSGDRNAVRCVVTDQKDAEPSPAWFCRLDPIGASAVIVPVADTDIIGGSQAKVLEALAALPMEDRTATKWQEMADSYGVSRTVFFEAKKQLLARGRVTGGARGALYQLDEEAP